MNPAVWPIIIALCSTALVLGVLAACIERTQFQRRARRWAGMLWFLRWTRVCMCGHSHEVHRHYRPGSDCGRCGCWQWRPFLVRRHRPREEPEPLQRRRPAPGKPRDGRPLDGDELRRLEQIQAALATPPNREESLL